MKRKLISILAAATAMPVAAMAADGPTATVYGNINLSIDTFNNYNTTAAAASDVALRPRMTSNASYFGVKGSEGISPDYSAVFQIESGLGNDIIPGTLSSRNSGIGLKGPFGQVMLGLWDTPVKALTFYMEPFYATGTMNVTNLIDSAGFGTPAVSQASGGGANTAQDLAFNRRQGDTIQYWNNWGAIQFKAMYGFGGNGTVLPMRDMYAGSLVFDDMGLILGVGYEVHNNFRTGNPATGGSISILAPALSGATLDNTKDTDLKATVGYRFGGTQIAGVASFITYNNNTSVGGTSSTYSRPAFGGTLMHKLGNFTPKVMYTTASDGSCTFASGTACSATGQGATQFGLGASYAYSKRTEAYIHASRLMNGSAANYTFAVPNASGTIIPTAAGANSDVISIGMRHVF